MEMSPLENSLARLEKFLGNIFEAGTDGNGLPRKLRYQLQQVLVRAMRQGLVETMDASHPGDTQRVAPDQYTLVLPPPQAQTLLSHPTALDQLARLLQNTATRENIHMHASPILQVVADPAAQEIKVLCERSQAGEGKSSTLGLSAGSSSPGSSASASLPNAFLIVNGLHTYAVTQGVTNIGSGASNQLVLNDPHVSSQHAQLRFIAGRFMIFDLGSVGGTQVNGASVSSQVLDPGDVILLAGVPIVFGQEQVPFNGYTQELPTSPPPPPVEIL